MKRQSYRIMGMSCSACVLRVEKGVSTLNGISKVQVSLIKNRLDVEYDETLLADEQVIAAVKASGYDAALYNEAAIEQGADASEEKRRLYFSLLCFLPLLAVHHLWHDLVSIAVQMLLLLPILWCNKTLLINGIKGVLHGSGNMNTLITIGVLAGLGYSFYDLFYSHEGVSYIESAGMILTVVSFGKWLEKRATSRTGDVLDRLREMLPTEAIVVKENGVNIVCRATEVKPGDTIMIMPGSRIPVDAQIIEGVSTIDESMLTGESIPVEKVKGSGIYAGTLNGNGQLMAKASVSQSASVFSDIIRTVDEVTGTKVPMARLAEKLMRVFVPIIVFIALVAAVGWYIGGAEISFCIGSCLAVLVVSCPCALGLATPISITLGAERGGEWGILFRSGESMERICKVDAIVFDKTGTLTAGNPEICDVIPMPGISEQELLKVACGLEACCEHPLSRAFPRSSEKYEVLNFQYLPGLGIEGYILSEKCAMGNAKLMADLEILVDISKGETLSAQGKTLLYVSRGNHCIGMIAVKDSLKKGSREAIAAMKRMGLHLVMLTGDNERTAKAIANQVGLDDYLAQVSPQEKLEKICQLQELGYCVAMIGDGINDSPALNKADVGVSLGSATAVAQDSASLILCYDDMRNFVRAMELSRSVVCNIRQNLFWALFYNVLMIPLAAGVYYSVLGWQLTPGISALAMSLSSLCVVGNAFRLRYMKIFVNEMPEHKCMENKITIKVKGMMCPHCERHVNTAISALSGVIACQADFKTESVTITFSSVVDELLIKETIVSAGYEYLGVQR